MSPLNILITASLLIAAALSLFKLRGGAGAVRRLVWSLTLILVGGCFLWSVGSGVIPVGRAHVVLTGPDVSIEQLTTLLKGFDPGDPVCFVTLRDDFGNPADPDTFDPGPLHSTWRRANTLVTGGPSGILAAMREGRPIDASREDWSLEVENAFETAFRSRRWVPSLRRSTLSLVHDDGPLWKDLRPGVFSTSRMLRKLALHDAEMILFRVDHQLRSGSLLLETDENSYPAVDNVGSLSGAGLSIRLVGLPNSVEPDDLQTTVLMKSPLHDGSPRLKEFEFEGPISFESIGDDGGLVGIFYLGTLRPVVDSAGGRSLPDIAPGLHLVTVRVRCPLPDAAPVTYAAEIYIEFTRSHFVMIGPTKSFELRSPLHARGWLLNAEGGVLPPKDAGVLFRDFMCRPKFNQSTRTRHYTVRPFPQDGLRACSDQPIDPRRAREQGLEDRAAGCDGARVLNETLDQAGSLVLMEPSLELLWYLDGLLDLDARIPSGLNVLIIGPPVGAAEAPAFVPSYALPADPDDPEAGPLRVRRDHRIAFAFDNSRIMRLPNQSGDPTGLQVQASIASRVLEKLGIGATDAFRVDNSSLKGPDPRLFRPRDPTVAGLDGARFEYFVFAQPRLHVPRNIDEDFGLGRYAEGFLKDLAPGHIDSRLKLLYENAWSDDERYAADVLEPGWVYPNTHVVLFVSDLPQLTAGVPQLAGPKGPLSFFDGDEASRHMVARLASQGVRVHVVAIRQDLPGHAAYLRSKNAEPLSDCIAIDNDVAPVYKEVVDAAPLITRYEVNRKAPNLTADAILAAINTHNPGTIDLRNPGRVVDERIADGALAPNDHIVLDRALNASSNRRLAPDNATISPSGPSDAFPEAPLIVSAYHGEGLVVVSAYSPFAQDVWDTDAGRAAWTGGPECSNSTSSADHLQGWGVQRMIDLEQLSGAIRPLGDRALVIERVSVSQDRSRLRLRCWFRDIVPPGGSAPEFPSPELRFDDKSIRYHRRSVDLARGSTLFELVAEDEEIKGGASIVAGADQPATPIAVWLEPADVVGADLLIGLNAIASFSGGSVAKVNDGVSPHRHELPSAWLGTVLLTVGAIVLFSPAVRPWTAFILFLTQRRKRKEMEGKRRPKLDASSFVIDWGPQLYRPVTGKVAGDPGGIKRYEPGDRISSAVGSSLFPFTSLRHTTGLPQKRPIVKLTYITQSTSAHIMVDNTMGLGFPPGITRPSKTEYAEFFSAVLALVIWQQGGTVSASSASSEETEFGPSMSSSDLTEFESYLLEALRRRPVPNPAARLVLPDALGSGGLLFLVSDLLAHEPEELEALAKSAVERGWTLRVARLYDPNEQKLIGLASEPGSWRLHDRTVITPTQLATDDARRNARFQSAATAFGGKYLFVDVSRPQADLIDSLLSTSFLNPN